MPLEHVVLGGGERGARVSITRSAYKGVGGYNQATKCTELRGSKKKTSRLSERRGSIIRVRGHAVGRQCTRMRGSKRGG